MYKQLILAINPGSTSTKIAVFDGENKLFDKNIKHQAEDLKQFEHIADQYAFRKELCLKEVADAGFDIKDFKIIIGRGGLTKSTQGGIWEVTPAMIHDLQIGYAGQHACNLGGLIANEIAKEIGVKAVIADAGVTDEREEIAKLSGHPLMPRNSIFHCLNQKAIARRYAREHGDGKKYEDLNLIVVHLGGGISVGAHYKGKVIDANQALDGDGPFSPERSGSVPMTKLISLCFSGQYTEQQIRKMIVGEGGYVAYLGTNDALTVEIKAKEGDEKFAFIQSAMAYQVAKEVGAQAAVLHGKAKTIDAVLITGGIAYGKPFVKELSDRIDWIAPIYVYPGEDEMGALAMNATMYLNGELQLQQYE